MDSSTTGAELAEDDDEDDDEGEDADADDEAEGTVLAARPEFAVCADDEDDDCVGRFEALEDCAVVSK